MNLSFLTQVDCVKQLPVKGLGEHSFINIIGAIADNGGNHARIWSCTDYSYGTMGLENWSQGMGWYNLDRAAALDRIIDYARSRKVNLELTFESFSSLNIYKQWYGEFNDYSIYNTRNGGPIDDPQAFWTDAQSKQAFKNRMRYSVARWGWNITIGMWELMNEIDGTDGYRGTDLEEFGSEWVTEMADYLKSIDPYQRMVSLSSATELSNCPVTFGNSNVELAQPHTYKAIDMAEAIANMTANGLRYNSRVLISEFGLDSSIVDGEIDPNYESMHIGMWAGLHSGGTGVPMYWWWNGVVESGSISHLQPLSKYISVFTFSTEKLVATSVNTSAGLSAMGRVTEEGSRAILWIYNNKYRWNNPDPTAVNNGTVTLKEIAEGPYKVQLWDTRTGVVTKTDTLTVGSNGELIISVGTVVKDIAVIVTR